jgi:hypothetical protein
MFKPLFLVPHTQQRNSHAVMIGHEATILLQSIWGKIHVNQVDFLLNHIRSGLLLKR